MCVNWYKNGKQLKASHTYNTKVTGNSCALECLHEYKDTSGVYACEVSNAYGTDICFANVTVLTGQSTYTDSCIARMFQEIVFDGHFLKH